VAGRGLGRIVIVARNTFREAVRERILLNLVLFAILLIISGLVLRELSIRQDLKVIKDLSLAAMDVFGTVIAVFVGVGLVSKEIERRSVYPLLAKPLTRDEFLLGKFAGLAFTLFVNLAAMTVGMFLTLAATSLRDPIKTDILDPGLLEAAFAIYASLLLVIAIALLFSTLASPTIAALSTVTLVVVGHYSDVVRNMREILPGVPGWVSTSLYFVLPNFQTFDLKHAAVHGRGITPAEMGWIVLYAAAYTAFVLTATLILFRKKELR
jgi:ABC-type transport system involved in multi-copper enzyme maturation permease subunit